MTTIRDPFKLRSRVKNICCSLLIGVLTGCAANHGADIPESEKPNSDSVYVSVLGIAQDAGTPQVGCYSDNCERAREAGQLFASSLMLVDKPNNKFFLFDASPDIRAQFDLVTEPSFRTRAAERSPLDGIFLTHAHMGHYVGLAHLGKEGMGMIPTPTYVDSSMASFLSQNGPWSLMVEEGRLDLVTVIPNRSIALSNSLSAMPIAVPHRAEYTSTLGWIIKGPSKTVLYLPDIDRWEEMNPSIITVLEEYRIDVALLDGSFYSGDELPGRDMSKIPHPTIVSSMKYFSDSLASNTRIIFTHLNNSNPAAWPDTPEARSVTGGGFEIASQGMSIGL